MDSITKNLDELINADIHAFRQQLTQKQKTALAEWLNDDAGTDLIAFVSKADLEGRENLEGICAGLQRTYEAKWELTRLKNQAAIGRQFAELSKQAATL